MEDSTNAGAKPLLLVNLLSLLQAHRAVFKQERVYMRGVALVLAEVMAFGRHTVTQLLQVLGVTEGDWSSWRRLWSKPRVEEERLAQQLVCESLVHVSSEEYYVIGTDGTQIPRTSGRMPGVSWLKSPRTPVFSPGIHRAQRFVHGCWFTPMANGYSRAIPLRFVPAFPAKAKAGLVAACKEWEAGIAFVQWLRMQLDCLGREAQPVLYLADSSYETAELWKALPPHVTAASRRQPCAGLPGGVGGRPAGGLSFPRPSASTTARGSPASAIAANRFGPRWSRPSPRIRGTARPGIALLEQPPSSWELYRTHWRIPR